MPTYNPIVGNYRVSSGFGTRESPNGIGSTNHRGIDMAAGLGTDVVAPTDITIQSAGYNNGGYGNLIRGVDGAGNMYEFGHLSAIDTFAGEKVAAGSIIGQVGSTGHSTGNHLHFGIKDASGNFINPAKFLSSATRLVSGKAIGAGSDLAKRVAGALGVAGAPIIGPLLAGAKLAGIGGDENCGDLDYICKLRKWLKDGNFWTRFLLVVIGAIFLIAAFSLLARGQVSAIKNIGGKIK